MRLLNHKILWACVLIISFSGQVVHAQKSKEEMLRAFSSDSAYSFIENQLSFGPRVPGMEGHAKCANFIKDKLKSYGASVTIQYFTAYAYDSTKLSLQNIIGSYNPEASHRILLAAHWDTRPFADKDSINKNQPIPGANDGGSGTAVLLEIARILQKHPLPDIGVDMIFFDGEDFGEPQGYKMVKTLQNAGAVWWCLGSQYWSKNMHQPDYSAKYGILLDMVGGKDARFFKEGGSMQFAKKYVNKVWKKAKQLGYDEHFINKKTRGIMDDHIFVSRDAAIPMINIIEYHHEHDNYFPDYHHTHGDNLSIIDKKTLQVVGETVLFVIYNE